MVFENYGICVCFLFILFAKPNALEKLDLYPDQKCTTILYMLAYRVARDVMDKYWRLSDNIVQEAMQYVMIVVRACFESTYVRKPIGLLKLMLRCK